MGSQYFQFYRLPANMLSSLLRSTSRPQPISGAVSMTAMVSALGLASFSSSASRNAEEPKVALSPKEFRSFKVTKVEDVTHDTKRLVFALPSKEHEMGITVASCLMAKAQVDGKAVVRPYTPTNTNAEKGELELVVKGYPTGKLSKHIINLKEGDELAMKGPFVKFEYKPNQYKAVGFLCGGSGITPALQVVKEICRNPEDSTQVVLVFCNQTEKDIILRDELDALQYMYPQFHVHYVLDKAEAGWEGRTGYVTKELIQELMPEPSDDNLIGVCGPPPMMNAISGNKAPDRSQGELKGLLKELGFTLNQVFKF
ncbi:hypothetical protein BBO99_00005086 [Phytophthora kernoviae]|uniref:cytochrome-b5 reductase n=2 Tax=Phytophthora kernoviae TaxID=325452 RepID=A0A3R7J981_9STRA|nr:hypothetical protein G195_005545 [Phytophthora kernoviae 00238/432]KAG2523531.1 hypothetical protein JM16_004795 [Phytophthora kernoviae]KAG2525366.1 hypothetical protein JM18_004408 [Phytophthora kernoviae]RLN21429.1 hypothetical protein BBI17_005173 [Phytophthora kernoviae]RLN79677.1 hypothetical protein BBO99_00005086 [Phytophthora kernoviae]